MAVKGSDELDRVTDGYSHVGSHGTTRTAADRFNAVQAPAGHGRAGHGVYAWVKSEFYIELANAWYRKKCSSGDYARHADTTGVVLVLGYSLHPSELEINLTEPEYQDRLFKLVASIQGVNVHDDHEVGKIADAFLGELEQELGMTVSVLRFMTDYPKEKFMDARVLPGGRWPRSIWPKVWAYCYRFPRRAVICSELEVPLLA